MATTRMYVKTDAKENNNKFWEVTLHDNGDVETRYGRVGTAGSKSVIGSGEKLFNAKIREKERKGYQYVEVLSGTPTATGASSVALKTAAQEQIAKGCPIVSEFVKRLAEINKHQIFSASGGQINVDLDSGIVRTPVGVITENNIIKARDLLGDFEVFVSQKNFDAPSFMNKINEYLMLVPQKVNAQRGWHRVFLPSVEALVKQNALLDQLQASISVAEKQIKDAQKAVKGETPQIFDVSMSQLTDAKTWERIQKYCLSTVNDRHETRHLRPKRAFVMEIGDMRKKWEEDGAKVGGTKELFHGTRAHNLLSILKGGLIVPKSGGSIHVTGRMFGDGLYFSDQSTKALNYSYGYWDGGARDKVCYTFLADVAMGKPYVPSGPKNSLRNAPDGFDSVFAKGRSSGVANNEMIVYRTGQANLKYLIEWS